MGKVKINKLLGIVIILFIVIAVILITVYFNDNNSKKREDEDTIELSDIDEAYVREELPQSYYFLGDKEEENIKDDSDEEDNIDVISLDKLISIRYRDLLDDDIKNKSHIESKNNEILKKVKKEADDIVLGSFGWDYRNEDNKDNFIKYRNGEYFYNHEYLEVDDLYNRIHGNFKEYGIYFDYSIDYSEDDIYIHPEEGGYVISGILNFSYSSDKGVEIFNIEPNEYVKIPIEIELLNIQLTDEEDVEEDLNNIVEVGNIYLNY